MAIGDSEVGRTAQADPVSQRVQVRRAAMASTIGTTIEWYDFFLYGTAAALVFPKLFFPASSAYAGTMQSLRAPFRRVRRTSDRRRPSSATSATGSAARPRWSCRCW